jgi:hypothetical protein
MMKRCTVLFALFVAALAAADRQLLSATEREIVRYLNEARTDPAGFAERYLASETRHPDARHRRTAEECVLEMKALKAMPPLKVSTVLSSSAQHHAEDLGRTGNSSHYGSDGSTLSQRIYRYGAWFGNIAENYSYGYEEPLKIVVELLLDYGVEGRGHRKAILNPKFRYVGVGVRPHRWFKTICVQDFAVLVQPE